MNDPTQPALTTRKYILLAFLPGAVQIVCALVLTVVMPETWQQNPLAVWAALLGLNFVVAIFVYLHVVKSTKEKLNVILANEKKLLRREELSQSMHGQDELALVDQAFHRASETFLKGDQNRQDFISMVTHDLRSPLTSLQAMFTVLESGVLGEIPEKALRRIQNAQASLQRLMQLTDELLDIRKLEEGKMEVSVQACNLQSIIDRAAQSVEDLAEKKSITIERPNINITVLADEGRIIQVLVNLLSNAIKFSYKNGVVKIAVEETEDEVEIQVIDHGRGMSLKHRSAVFDRFRQTESGRSAGGSGLGLNIAKAIISEHNGEIGFDSTEGVGSKFWFRLSRIPAEGTRSAKDAI